MCRCRGRCFVRGRERWRDPPRRTTGAAAGDVAADKVAGRRGAGAAAAEETTRRPRRSTDQHRWPCGYLGGTGAVASLTRPRDGLQRTWVPWTWPRGRPRGDVVRGRGRGGEEGEREPAAADGVAWHGGRGGRCLLGRNRGDGRAGTSLRGTASRRRGSALRGGLRGPVRAGEGERGPTPCARPRQGRRETSPFLHFSPYLADTRQPPGPCRTTVHGSVLARQCPAPPSHFPCQIILYPHVTVRRTLLQYFFVYAPGAGCSYPTSESRNQPI